MGGDLSGLSPAGHGPALPGTASYWHAELLHHYNGVSPQEMLEFARLHAGVVNPGGRFSVNPYYLGYTVLVDIEQRWDRMHAAGESSLTGRQKLFEVRRTEDDISFLCNYLTTNLVDKMGLFAYGNACSHPPGQRCARCQKIVITGREREAILEALLTPRYHYGVPRIVVQDVVHHALYLEHLDRDASAPIVIFVTWLQPSPQNVHPPLQKGG